MGLKEKIIDEIKELSPDRLSLVVDYIRLLKQAQTLPDPGGWKKYVGAFSDEKAAELQQIIDKEFNSVEGEW